MERSSSLNARQNILSIYQHQPVDEVVFQPRMEYWFNRNRELGHLPPRLANLELFEFFDTLGCAIRAYGPYGSCLETIEAPGVKYETFTRGPGGQTAAQPLAAGADLFQVRAQFTNRVFPPGSQRIDRITTPVGVLETHITYTDRSWHTDQYPVQSPADVRPLKYLLEGTQYRFNYDRFREIDALIGPRSVPMLFLPRVNIQRLSVEFLGFEKTMMALYDDLNLMEDLIQTINTADERVMDAVVPCPIPIISFDDNIDQHLCSPRLFARYILPAYQHRSARMHAAGKKCHAHWDGHCRLLLPFLDRTGLVGVEALTPLPQGDLTIADMKTALGEDLILLDGIPMTAFLPHTPQEDFEHITREIIETFAPNLILGISDEPSPDCLLERIERVVAIAAEYRGKVMDLAARRQTQIPVKDATPCPH